MTNEIKDGTGKGYIAKVDSDNRLHVNGVSRTQSEQAALLSQAYNLSTGTVTLTSDTKSCIAYMKYTGTDPFVIKEILAIPSESTGGTGRAVISLEKNPTTGTIIDNAVVMPSIQNRDFSSSELLDANLYKGVDGDTITDGSVFGATSRSNFDVPITFDAANIVLRKGNSISVCITPPSGNTSQTWIVVFVGFVETSTVSGDLK